MAHAVCNVMVFWYAVIHAVCIRRYGCRLHTIIVMYVCTSVYGLHAVGIYIYIERER